MMPLRRTVEDREYDKFTLCNDLTSVRVTQCGTTESRPTGLNVGMRVTEVTLSSTAWTALPTTALTNRNYLGVQNLSGIEKKINSDSIDALPAGYVGVVVANGVSRMYDIQTDITIYAKAASGTPTVIVEELA